jgi:hypothetical protein
MSLFIHGCSRLKGIGRKKPKLAKFNQPSKDTVYDIFYNYL